MDDWIRIGEGEYAVAKAYLAAADGSAVLLERAVISVSSGPGGRRRLSGRGVVKNILIIELLEDSDDLDLVLDLGSGFIYRLKNPVINAGKVFSPHVKSTLHFYPSEPWSPMVQDDYDRLVAGFTLVRSESE